MYLSLPEWMEWSKWKGQDGSWVFSMLSNWCKESKLLMRSKLKRLVKIWIKKLDQNINFNEFYFHCFSQRMHVYSKQNVNKHTKICLYWITMSIVNLLNVLQKQCIKFYIFCHCLQVNIKDKSESKVSFHRCNLQS